MSDFDNEVTAATSSSDRSMWRRYWRRFWRVGVGSVLILAGIAMCVLPGPGILTIVAGLAVMADEVPLAERLMNRLKDRTNQVVDKVRKK